MIYTYLNGILSKANSYVKTEGSTIGETFVDTNDIPATLIIDSTAGQVDLYGIRIYSTAQDENVILNNRGYDGSKIYEEATPLYTINLDAVAIKQIREYNKKQNREDEGYADFNLSCTNGAYCISSFLHNGQFTTADGKSILDQYNSTCASAKDKNSFISCYRRARTS